MLSSRSILRVAPAVVSAPVDGEVTVLDPRSGTYFGFEDVGARVWSLIGESRSIADISRALHAEYVVDPAECEADVTAFVEELVERGLVEVVAG